tara:strand:+ start:1286 stop:1846 length:561 start_codon:yes stop_codon:yes gene_type:complete
MTHSLRFFAAFALLALAAQARATLNTNDEGVALEGHDPVAFFTVGAAVPGKASISADHEGATYHFAKKTNRAYLNQINRILGDDHPAGQWDSDSHILNLDWKITEGLQLTGYSYLLSFDNAAANNTSTHGLFLSESRALSDGDQFIYRAESALQRDARESPLNYEASYFLLEVGFKNKSGTLTFGR